MIIFNSAQSFFFWHFYPFVTPLIKADLITDLASAISPAVRFDKEKQSLDCNDTASAASPEEDLIVSAAAQQV